MGPIFDTHAHYGSHAFGPDRPAVLDGLPGQGVSGIIDCGTDLDTSEASRALAHSRPWIWAAAGIHPESLIEEDSSTTLRFGGDWRAELAALRPLFEDERVVAVGEVGLDHHWPVPRQEQLDLFEAQIRLALELDKPVIVHDRQAHEPTYALLRRYRPRGVLHCYSGSAEDALALAELGFYFGFGGAVTFKGAKRAVKAVQALPAERILLETDCPYMAPEPLRGQRCDSAMIAHTAAFIADVRAVSPEELLTLTDANARRLFRLP